MQHVDIGLDYSISCNLQNYYSLDLIVQLKWNKMYTNTKCTCVGVLFPIFPIVRYNNKDNINTTSAHVYICFDPIKRGLTATTF